MKTSRRWGLRTLAFGTTMLVVCGLAACGGSGQSDTIRVMALWTGAEEEAFGQVLDRFEARTGIQVEYTGGREVPAALAEAVATGSPPEVAVLSDPVAFGNYVDRRKLIPLNNVLDSRQMDAQYPESWRTLMRAGSNSYYAVVVKASLKSLIWYNPQVFKAQALTPPRTWPELTALSRRAVDSGTPPWCLGLEATQDSGWPGTDWIEDILLHQSGPELYQKWVDGTLPWTSPEVIRAWQRWGELIGPAGAVDGGAPSALLTNYGRAGTGMFDSKPACLMDHEPSFIMANYTAISTGSRKAQPGKDFDLFPFPAIDDRYANALEVGADLAGMFKDTPQARALITFLASPEAQQIWPGVGDAGAQANSGALSPNTAVPLSVYGNPISMDLARMVTGRQSGAAQASTSRLTLSFDASDLMPAAVRTAFYQAVLQYVADPPQLSNILSQLDQVRARSLTSG